MRLTVGIISTVGPKEIITSGAAKVPHDIILETMGHTSRLFLWGHLIYRDIFPQTKPHILMYCKELAEVRADFKNVGSTVEYVWDDCDRHNCADEDCKGEPYGTPMKTWQ
jgi:hypothetical protein